MTSDIQDGAIIEDIKGMFSREQYMARVWEEANRRLTTERPVVEKEIQKNFAEAFPWTTPPKYLLRHRDGVYGNAFRKRVQRMGLEEVLIAAQSPWQNPYAERLIGSIRRECLDHVIVFSERHLMRILRDYFRYYHRWRTHQSLEMDCPQPREIHALGRGPVVEIPEFGGLHHHYERIAA